MKQMRNKVNALSIALVLALLTGCGGAENINSSQAAESALVLPFMTSIREAAGSVDPETLFENETETESRIAEENPFAKEESTLRIDREDIINYDEASEAAEEEYETLWYTMERNLVVEEYSADFPIELQDVLMYCNDDVSDERDDDWQEYAAELTYISVEEGDDLYEEIAEYFREYEDEEIVLSSLPAVDIDGDGINEYVVRTSEGRTMPLWIMKDFDGKMAPIGGDYGVRHTYSGVLEYEGKYYLLLDEILIYWREGSELLDYKYWVAPTVLGQEDCWISIWIRKCVTDYTPYEMYSCYEEDSVDYLADIDLTTLEDAGAEIFYEDGWSPIDGWTWLDYGWEREYAGERYVYAISLSFGAADYYTKGEKDRTLTILREEDGKFKIAKVYYMAANYEIEFEDAY